MLEPGNQGEQFEADEAAEEGVLRTFLIADVRGYTRFTQTRGDEAAAELAGRFALLTREVVTAGGGELIELRGDEALAAFTSPRQAVRTAVDVQRRLRGASDPDEALPLGVGIGLDTGEAVPVEGGYRGKALNVAARLCSLAAPGQIFATDTVCSLAGSVPGVRFVGRKPVRVKGIEQPVRLLEVVPDEPLPALPSADGPAQAVRKHRALIGLAAAAAAVVLAAILALTVFGGESEAGQLAANSLGSLDASGRIKDVIPMGAGPADIAYGAGSLWVANELDRSIWRVDPGSQEVVRLRIDAQPTALAFGDEALWVLDAAAREVLRLDAATEGVVQRYPVGNAPSDVAYGRDAVWVTNQLDGTVTRVDAPSGTVRTIGVGIEPVAAAWGAGGLWVANAGGDNVVQVDAATGALQSIPVGHDPRAIAVSSDAVWVASAADGTVWEIDPATKAARRTVPVGQAPSALAAVDNGVWVASEAAGTVSKVSGASEAEMHEVGGGPTALQVVDDRLWVTALAPRASHRGGTLRIAGPFPVTDPYISSYGANVNPMLNDGLVAYKATGGPGGATLVPNLATAIPKPTDGETRYTFHVRRGVRYSTGAEVRPSHFRSSFERMFRVAELAFFFETLVGAPECLEQPRTCDLSNGILTDDEAMTVTFVLQAPDPEFLYKLAFPIAWVVPPETLQRVLTTRIVASTGPYRIASVQPNRRMVLVRNPHFREWSHDAQPDGYPDRIVIIPSDTPQSLKRVLSGKADAMVDPVPEDRAARLAVRSPGQLHTVRSNRLQYFFLNTELPPFDHLGVRQAVSLALDRGAYVERVGGPLYAQPTCQVIPPNVLGYKPHCPWTRGTNSGVWTAPDLQRARALVRASGTRGARVTVWTAEHDPLRSMADELAAALGRLGYRVTVRVAAGTVFDYYGRVADPRTRAQAGPATWAPDVPTPGGLFGPLLACDAPPELRYARFCDRSLDRAAADAAALQASSPQAAAEAWAKVDSEAVRVAPIVPLAVGGRAEIVSRRVGNYQAHPMWGVLYSQLWVR